jgi:Fic family protein
MAMAESHACSPCWRFTNTITKVGRYISLERLTEESKEDYYESLHRSSQRWHGGKHDLIPWLNFFLAIIRRACTEFEQRAGQIKSPRGAKSALVLDAIQRQPGEFSVSEIQRECPGVGLDMIRHLLDRLRKEKKIKSLGTGRSARWEKLN